MQHRTRRPKRLLALTDPADLAWFWARVSPPDERGCRVWTGATNEDGYGVYRARVGAHRLAFAIADGEVPEGVYVLHTCDNPPCCERSHLYLGDQFQNMRDRRDRGRAPDLRGERHGRSILTDEQAIEMRHRYAAGERAAALAAEYGMSASGARKIIQGIVWDHLPGAVNVGKNGRPTVGMLSARAVLTDAIVVEIRARYAGGGWTYKALGQEFGVGKTAIEKIVKRERWRHLP